MPRLITRFALLSVALLCAGLASGISEATAGGPGARRASVGSSGSAGSAGSASRGRTRTGSSLRAPRGGRRAPAAGATLQAARAQIAQRVLRALRAPTPQSQAARPPAGKTRPASGRDLSPLRRAYLRRYLPGGAGDPGPRARSLSLRATQMATSNTGAGVSDRRSIELAHRRQSSSNATASQPAWPPNRGFAGEPQRVTLPVGTRIDRYGYEGGRFVSPVGTPFPQRALPAEHERGKPYNVYVTTRPITVDAGKAAPWFGQPGGGMQYQLPGKVRDHIAGGDLALVGVSSASSDAAGK